MSLSSLFARRSGLALLCAAACVLGGVAHAAPDARIAGLAAREKQPLLDSLSQLVGIESGSRDLDGLDRIAELIAGRLRALGDDTSPCAAERAAA